MALHGHTNAVMSVAFSPDGERFVSGSADATIKVWNAGTGEEEITLSGHADEVRAVAFSPDGKRIVSCSPKHHVMKVWDTETGTEVLTIRLRAYTTLDLAFSPDGRRIASAGYSAGVVEVYDSGPWVDAGPLTGPASLPDCGTTASDRRSLSPTSDGHDQWHE